MSLVGPTNFKARKSFISKLWWWHQSSPKDNDVRNDNDLGVIFLYIYKFISDTTLNSYMVEGYSLYRIKMTRWIWQKSVNMTQNIINIITTTNIKGWVWPKIYRITKQLLYLQCYGSFFTMWVSTFGQIHPYFGQVRRLMLVGEKFRSCSNINVCWCEILSVKF